MDVLKLLEEARYGGPHGVFFSGLICGVKLGERLWSPQGKVTCLSKLMNSDMKLLNFKLCYLLYIDSMLMLLIYMIKLLIANRSDMPFQGKNLPPVYFNKCNQFTKSMF